MRALEDFNDMPVLDIEPDSPFDTTLAPDTPIETPTPVISYPSNWEQAAIESEQAMAPTIEPETSLAWNPVEAVEADQTPTYVFNKDDYAASPTYPTIEPVYQKPLVTSQETPPIFVNPLPVSYEVPNMMSQPYDGGVCNCITAPCDCDGLPSGGGLPVIEPPPIVDPPLVVPPVTPINVPVTTPPPVVNVTVQTQTPTVQNAGGQTADGEPTLIFGYPWYYVAGAAAAALFLMSSMDGKK